jgi:hypothetical protein
LGRLRAVGLAAAACALIITSSSPAGAVKVPEDPSTSIAAPAHKAAESVASAISQSRLDLAEERAALAAASTWNLDALNEPCGTTVIGRIDESQGPDAPVPSVQFVGCCKICSLGYACGNSCISRTFVCHQPGGCACDAANNAPVAPITPTPISPITPTSPITPLFPTTPITPLLPVQPLPIIGPIDPQTPTPVTPLFPSAPSYSGTPEYTRFPEVAFRAQSPYPRVALGQSAKLRLTVDRLHGPAWFDQDVRLLVTNTSELTGSLRGWGSDGLLAYNTGRTFLSDTQDFDFLVEGLTAGTFRLRVALYHPNFGWFGPDGMYWDVAVDGLPTTAQLYEGWHSRWLSQSPYLVMAPGQVTEFWIRFTNVGTSSWLRGTWGQQVNLALNGDNKIPFRLGMAADWLWDDRLATTAGATTAPGDVAEFHFKVRAPVAAGTYQLNLRPVVDGTTWLEDEGVFWQIVVR